MKTIPSRDKTSARSSRSARVQPHAARGNGHSPAPSNGHGVRPEVSAWLKRPKQNLIGGRWTPCASGKLFDVLNPADASLLSRVPDSQAADIDRAVAAARKAFESGPWRRMTPSERGKMLWRVGDLLLKH